MTCSLPGQLCSTDTMNYELGATPMQSNYFSSLHHPLWSLGTGVLYSKLLAINPVQTDLRTALRGDFPIITATTLLSCIVTILSSMESPSNETSTLQNKMLNTLSRQLVQLHHALYLTFFVCSKAFEPPPVANSGILHPSSPWQASHWLKGAWR